MFLNGIWTFTEIYFIHDILKKNSSDTEKGLIFICKYFSENLV